MYAGGNIWMLNYKLASIENSGQHTFAIDLCWMVTKMLMREGMWCFLPVLLGFIFSGKEDIQFHISILIAHGYINVIDSCRQCWKVWQLIARLYIIWYWFAVVLLMSYQSKTVSVEQISIWRANTIKRRLTINILPNFWWPFFKRKLHKKMFNFLFS